SETHGATMQHLTKPVFDALPFLLPPLDEQKKIANKLDRTTDIITNRKSQLKKLDLLVKSRFIEMFGDPVENNRNWNIKSFGDVCCVRQGLQIPIAKRLVVKEDDCYEYITVAYLHGTKEREYIKKPKATVVCKKSDILMTRTGNTGMVVTDVEGVFHNNFFLIDFNKNLLNKKFVVQYLNLDTIQKELLRRAGTAIIPDLNHGEFYKVKIYIPPIALQTQFATFVSQVDKSKSSIQHSLTQLETLKKAKMQLYFE
ncbi:MAG: restriction endonuclease subunit S, partial [Oscillospiraceae bacterium]